MPGGGYLPTPWPEDAEKEHRKTHQSESGACVTPGVDSVTLGPVSHGDQELALQLGGQAPSRAVEKMEEESTGQQTSP